MLQLILFLVPPLNIQLTTPYKFIPISPCHRFKWVQLFFGSMPSLHIFLCISYINFGVSPEIERIFEKLLHLVMQFPPFAFAHISLSLSLSHSLLTYDEIICCSFCFLLLLVLTFMWSLFTKIKLQWNWFVMIPWDRNFIIIMRQFLIFVNFLLRYY